MTNFSNNITQLHFLYQEIATRMVEHLALIKLEPQRILDINYGENFNIQILEKHFSKAQILSINSSHNMLVLEKKENIKYTIHRILKFFYTRLSTMYTKNLNNVISANFTNLPFLKNTIDLIWSNLILHHHPRPLQIFTEWLQILRQRGLLIFSCFGPDTFKEIRNAFKNVHCSSYSILPFLDMHDLGDMLIKAGFSTPVMDMEILTLTYNTPQNLLKHIYTWNTWRDFFLINHKNISLKEVHYKKLLNIFENMRDQNGKISLSFEIIYGHAFQNTLPKKIKNNHIIKFKSI